MSWYSWPMLEALEALEAAMANLRAACTGDALDYDKVLEAWQDVHHKSYSMQDSFWDKIDWTARGRKLNPHLYVDKVARTKTPTRKMTKEELETLMRDLGL